MKKFLLCFMFIFAVSPDVSALDSSDKSRFFFQLSPRGGALIPLSDDLLASNSPKGGGGLGIGFGFGLSDRFQMLLDWSGSISPGGGNTDFLLFMDVIPKVKYFFHSNGYLQGGIGYTYLREYFGGDAKDANHGMMLSTGVGYEWKLGTHFYISPELDLDYHFYFDGSKSAIAPKVLLNLGWSF